MELGLASRLFLFSGWLFKLDKERGSAIGDLIGLGGEYFDDAQFWRALSALPVAGFAGSLLIGSQTA